MDKSKKREIKRIRQMLNEIVGMAEDEEMEGGLPNAARRYNSIVRHLESEQVLPPGLFQLLNENTADLNFHQVGVESRMLAGYLEEVIDEEEEDETSKPDFSPVIALAPFLEQSDLRALVHSHLSGRGFSQPASAQSAGGGPPSLETLVSLAPHMHKKDLAEMLEACLARNPVIDPNVIVELAPHLDRQDLGRLLRQHAPNWFDPASQPARSSAAAAANTGSGADASDAERGKASWQDAAEKPETFNR